MGHLESECQSHGLYSGPHLLSLLASFLPPVPKTLRCSPGQFEHERTDHHPSSAQNPPVTQMGMGVGMKSTHTPPFLAHSNSASLPLCGSLNMLASSPPQDLCTCCACCPGDNREYFPSCCLQRAQISNIFTCWTHRMCPMNFSEMKPSLKAMTVRPGFKC